MIPPTSVLGAIILTGYLDGAIATQLCAGSDWFQVTFPAIIGTLVCIALGSIAQGAIYRIRDFL